MVYPENLIKALWDFFLTGFKIKALIQMERKCANCYLIDILGAN